jgi:hypothetical protein
MTDIRNTGNRSGIVRSLAAMGKILAIGTVVVATNAMGATIGWNFSDDNATYDTGTPVNFTIGSFSIGNTLGTVSDPVNSTSASSGYTGSTGTGNIGNAVRTGALSKTSGGSAYYEISFTPTAGYQLQITDFDFGTRSTGTGPQSFSLFSSIDAYGVALMSGSITNNSSWAYKDNTAFTLTAAANTPVTLRLYVYGGSGSPGSSTINHRLDDIKITVTANPVATGNNTAITASTTNVALGRVMQTASNPTNNVTLNKTGTDTTTYTVTAGSQATVADAGTSFTGGAQSDQISVGVNRSTTGAKSGTVTVDNTAASSAGSNQGSADNNEVINVSGTVVADRVISAESVDLGKVLVGTTTASQDSTLSTTGADADRTRVTVNGTTASNEGVTVAAGSSQLFNEASDTVDRSVSGNFSTSGSKNVNVNLSVTGEGLTGEAVNNVTVNATADVYQAAALTANNSSPLDLDTVSVTNAATSDGGQRAAARVISNTVSGEGWSVSGLGVGTVISQNTNATGETSFDETGKLNGTHLGTLVLGFEHDDQTIQGTAAGDLGTASWNLSHVVENNAAPIGTAEIRNGSSYAGFNLTNNDGRATNAELLAGSASGDTEVTISFDGLASGSYAALNDAFRVSDVVSLEGTHGDIIVLQLTYDDTSLGSAESDLRLMWFNGTEWVLAVEGNSSGTPEFFLGGYTNQAIGSYGVDTDTNTVWAVIDHNSDFAVIQAVPEPGSAMLLAATGVVLACFRRRSRKA